MGKDFKVCHIIGAGDFNKEAFLAYAPGKNDFLVAADGGYDNINTLGVDKIEPDLLVGDFDSLAAIPTGGCIMRYPSIKDQTDMLLAAEEGLARGYRTFFIYGGTGGIRPEHTMANYQLLSFLAGKHARGFLIGKDSNATIIRADSISFKPGSTGYLSVFSYSSYSYGVCVSGLKYRLEDAKLSSSFPLGVSNEFVGNPSTVSVRKGQLLIIWPGLLSDTVDFCL